jgi:casein kinase 1
MKQLYMEWNVYNKLKGTTGIPVCYHYGVEGDYNCLVMDALGPSLEDLFKLCKKKLTVKTVCMLGIQMI